MFGWTRLTRKTSSAKPQTSLRFRPALAGFEDRLVPASVPGLGAAAQFAVLGLDGGKVTLCDATVDGDLGLGAQATTKLKDAVVTGQVVADPSAQVARGGLTAAGGVTRSSLAPSRTVEDARTGSFTGAIIARDVTVRFGDAIHHAAFAPPADPVGTPATLSGVVKFSNGFGFAGVTVTLTGTDSQDNPVFLQTTTSNVNGEEGTFAFADLQPGTYTLSVNISAIGAEAGTVDGQANGTVDDADYTMISNIVLDFGNDGINYSFTSANPS